MDSWFMDPWITDPWIMDPQFMDPWIIARPAQNNFNFERCYRGTHWSWIRHFLDVWGGCRADSRLSGWWWGGQYSEYLVAVRVIAQWHRWPSRSWCVQHYWGRPQVSAGWSWMHGDCPCWGPPLDHASLEAGPMRFARWPSNFCGDSTKSTQVRSRFTALLIESVLTPDPNADKDKDQVLDPIR